MKRVGALLLLSLAACGSSGPNNVAACRMARSAATKTHIDLLLLGIHPYSLGSYDQGTVDKLQRAASALKPADKRAEAHVADDLDGLITDLNTLATAMNSGNDQGILNNQSAASRIAGQLDTDCNAIGH